MLGLFAIVIANPTSLLDFPAVALRLDPPPLGGSRGNGRSSRRLLVERSLDDFPEPFSRHFAISLAATVPVAMNDQNALTSKPGTQTSDQAGLRIRIEAMGLP